MLGPASFFIVALASPVVMAQQQGQYNNQHNERALFYDVPDDSSACSRAGTLFGFTLFTEVDGSAMASATIQSGESMETFTAMALMGYDQVDIDSQEDVVAMGAVIAFASDSDAMGIGSLIGEAHTKYGAIDIGFGETLIVDASVQIQGLLGVAAEYYSSASGFVSIEMFACLHPKNPQRRYYDPYKPRGASEHVVIPYPSFPPSYLLLSEEVSTRKRKSDIEFSVDEVKTRRFFFENIPYGRYDLIIHFIAVSEAASESGEGSMFASSESQLSVNTHFFVVQKMRAACGDYY